MIEIHSPEIKNKISKSKRKGIISIVFFLVIGLLLITLGIFGINKTKDMEEISSSASFEENIYMKLNIVYEPYVFGVSDNTTDKFCFGVDKDNHIYIVYLSNRDYEKLSEEFKEGETKELKGYSKRIPTEIKDLALETYNEDSEEPISNEEFAYYFGYVYLDTTDSYFSNSPFLTIGAIFTVFGLIFLIAFLINNNKIKKTLNKYTQAEWDKIEGELNSPANIFNERLYFTKNYLITFQNGIEIIKYTDIVWTYFIKQRYNGISTNRQVVVFTKDRKQHLIENFATFSKKRKLQVEELIELIGSKNKDILVGYTEENRQLAITKYNS